LTATTLLMLGLCGVILGSSAQAQNQQDPLGLVRTRPGGRDAGADPNSKLFRCARDRNRLDREEIDRAIRSRIETLYPNYCRGFESGRIFDIQMEEICIQGNAATVSYVLVLFETCEEGAPYEASRHKEKWIRRTKGWERGDVGPRSVP
jgi:hypothetical protein